jgi:hypothetical protein
MSIPATKGQTDVPEFSMRLTEDGRVSFVHLAQARGYLRRLFQTAGAEIVAQFYEYRQQRSHRQSRGFHAMVKPWLAVESRGGWTIEALKLYALGEVFGYLEFTHPVSGEVVRFPAKPHTSKLSVGEFCELIDRTLEIAAEEDGVILTAPDEYRRAKEAAAKKAARAARKEAA